MKSFKILGLILALGLITQSINAQSNIASDADLKEQVKEYSELISRNPKDFDSYFLRGLSYRALKQYDNAIKDFTKLLEAGYLRPLEVLAERAKTYREYGQTKLAETDEKYAAAMKVYHASFDAKSSEEKLTYLNKAIAIYPEYYVQIYIDRGNLHQKMKNYDLAVADFTKSIQVISQDFPQWNGLSNIYRSRADSYRMQKKFDLANNDYTKTIGINPKDDRAYLNRGLSYAAQNKFDLAINDYTNAIGLGSKGQSAFFAYDNRGHAYLNQKKFDLAVADFTSAIAFGGGSDQKLGSAAAHLYLDRASAYRFLEKIDLALIEVNKVIAIKPSEVVAYELRAEVYRKIGNTAAAAADEKKAAELSGK
ncbi:MAG TPA: tetratricopeptide repeat protein [Pyrinomonadaceae bacterium]